MTKALEEPAREEESQLEAADPRVIVGMPSIWPWELVPRWLGPALGLAIIAIFVGTIVFAYQQGWLNQDTWEGLGYVGIFATNFFPHATLFFPLPGLTVTGQVLIVVGAETLNPVLVGVVATAAMTLADCTSYVAGYFGRAAAQGRRLPNNFAGRWFGKTARFVDGWMHKRGFITLAVLSGVPNPIYEFAGVTAGAVRMNFGLFVLAVGLGNVVRIVALIIIGQAMIDFFDI